MREVALENREESGERLLCRCVHYGLSNRLIYLVSSRAIAEVSGRRLTCIWKPSFECDAEWSDLFAPADWFDPSGGPVAASRVLSVDKVWFNQFYLKYAKDTCRWEEFRRVVFHHLARLQPLDEIQNHVRGCLRDGDYVALHIRMTDNISCFRKTKQLFMRCVAPLETYLDIAAREIDRGMRVFVATDNRRVQQDMAQQYKDKVFFLDKAWRTRLCFVPRRNLRLSSMFLWKRTSPIPAALADLLILSAAKRLYGTCYSSYSKLAATIGRIDDFHMMTREGPVRSKDVDMMLRDGDPQNEDDES